MIKKIILASVLAGTMASCTFSQEGKTPKRLLREDCYLVLHFDFHALKTDRNIGANTTPEMVDSLLNMFNPDVLQIDIKGHPGVSSYPSKVGNHSNSFVGDPLRVWREVTARRGVALYGHYSGVLDDYALEIHPEWALVDAQGNRSASVASIFGPYVDQLMIPQLVELGVDYGLDGIWIDGNVWGSKIDYSDAAKEAFTKKTGIENAPTSPEDPNWTAWIRFQREEFRNFIRYYIAQVKEKVPGIQIGDNWAFSEHMPEPVSIDVDFISGDLGAYNCVNVARYASRFMASLDFHGDLMSWCAHQWAIGTLDPPESRKTAVQHQREAACVISQGLGYEFGGTQAGPGYPPRRDGSIDLEKVKPLMAVAPFLRERQEVSFKARAIPQIAVLYSTEAAYRKWDHLSRMFFWDAWQRGIVSNLLENRYCVEVLLGDKLVQKIEQYPLVVVCEWDYIEPEVRDAIARYVQNGGKLLLIGQSAISLFDKETASAKKSTVEVPSPYSMTRCEVGKGSIGVIPHTVTNEYAGNPTPELRDLIGTAVRSLFPDPMVTVTGSNDIDVSLMRTASGKLAVHLVNTSGPHRTAGKIETIDPVGPLSVAISHAKRPKKVVLEPGSRKCDYSYKDGKIYLTVESVPVHEIIVVEGRR